MTSALGRSIVCKLADSPSLNEEDQLAYAGAIIDRLRRERDDERVAHGLTRDALQSRVDILEAQLARRDAELEMYATHTSCMPAVLSGRNDANVGYKPDDDGSKVKRHRSISSPLDPGEPRNSTNVPPPGQALTNEAIIEMLNTTAARNRALEVEIKTLFKRLQQARSLPSPSSGASVGTASPRPPTRDGGPVPQSHPPPSSPKGDTLLYGVSEYGVGDGGDSMKNDFADDDNDEDRARYDQQWYTRTRNEEMQEQTGSSRTRAPRPDKSPSVQALYDDHRFNRHYHKAKRPKNSGAKVEAHEDQLPSANQDQGLDTPNCLPQSTPAPVSDAIDDHHSVYDDNSDTIWRRTAPAIGSSIRISANDAPSAQEHVNIGDGTSTGGTTPAVSRPNDPSSPNLHTASLRRLRSKSATLASLDEEIQELSSQIDAFRYERAKLTNIVADRGQTANQPQREGVPSPSHHEFTGDMRDDRSMGSVHRTDGVVKGEKQEHAAEYGDDENRVPYYENAGTAMVDNLTHRLSAVEQECLELRHELNECRTLSQSRENELMDEIRALESRIAELSLMHNASSNPTPAPFQSGNGHDIESTSSPPAGGQDQSNLQHPLYQQRSHHEIDVSLTPDYAPELVPENIREEDIRIPHLRPRYHASDEGNSPSVSEIQLSPPIEPYIEIGDPPHETAQPHAPPDAQVRWLRLDDTELDGLLDAIDGEVSMELATPLMPTTLLDLKSQTSDLAPCTGSDHENRDALSDHDSGSQEMVLDDLEDLQGTSFHHRHESELSHCHRENIQEDPGLHDGENDRGRSSNTGDMGNESGVIRRGATGLFSDDSQNVDDVDGGVGNSGNLHEPLPMAPLLRQREQEDELDGVDYSGADDVEERQQYDRSRESSPLYDDVHHDDDDPNAEQEDRDETVLVIPQSSRPRSQSPTPARLHPDASATRSELTSTSGDSHHRQTPRLQTPSPSSSASEEALRAELFLDRAEHELSVAQEILEQGENVLRSLEANLSLDLLSPPHSPTT
ncbi:hypothetical protein D9756_002832 [Leucocoprinus leucothites]|uniref:Uncharacterized protein n=1 Tax=Leucocoprinus leucothites TaxID=201217 RepID=A0A8H5GBI6_9AGAR|nr:hypothetical protein D9756_002832 [Leucoagaricus leucothites]